MNHIEIIQILIFVIIAGVFMMPTTGNEHEEWKQEVQKQKELRNQIKEKVLHDEKESGKVRKHPLFQL